MPSNISINIIIIILSLTLSNWSCIIIFQFIITILYITIKNISINIYTIIELTVPWDTTANMTAALQRKTKRYKELTTTIQGNGFKCSNIPLEVGTRGLINARNKGVLTKLCHGFKVGKVSSVIKSCSKLALLGSYTLWNARYSVDWSGGGYLKP